MEPEISLIKLSQSIQLRQGQLITSSYDLQCTLHLSFGNTYKNHALEEDEALENDDTLVNDDGRSHF